MKKLFVILSFLGSFICLSSQSWALPNCVGLWSASNWNNCTGTYVWKSGKYKGDKYLGEHKDGLAHGQGTYFFSKGDKYVGDWKSNKRHGQGSYTWGPRSKWAGDKYVGEYKDGKRTGEGLVFFANGQIQEGIFNEQLIEKKVYYSNKEIKENVLKETILNSEFPNFIWPVKGKIVKKFGIFGRGENYDGIDISVKNKVLIKSSLNGKVAFVGKIQKFGNLILIKHNKGWLTTYSNFDKFNVKEGEKLIQGQTIAYSDKSKKILHFQIRHNRNPIDPLTLIN